MNRKLAILRALGARSWPEVIARVSCVRNMPERLKIEVEPPERQKEFEGMK